MGYYYNYTIHYNRQGKDRKYEIGADNLDIALGTFFQDNTDVCYDDITEIETIENE